MTALGRRALGGIALLAALWTGLRLGAREEVFGAYGGGAGTASVA